jgi:hypothetical protein
MALEQTLEELTERRLAFKVRREQIEEELRQLRTDKLAAEQASIEGIIVRAMAQGATLGQIKRAYGTKDHRTISSIVAARAPEIQAVRDSLTTKKVKSADWFTFDADEVIVTANGHKAVYEWTDVDGKLMFITAEPRWNETATIENEAVALLDGKTEDDNDEARILAQEIRKRG